MESKRKKNPSERKSWMICGIYIRQKRWSKTLSKKISLSRNCPTEPHQALSTYMKCVVINRIETSVRKKRWNVLFSSKHWHQIDKRKIQQQFDTSIWWVAFTTCNTLTFDFFRQKKSLNDFESFIFVTDSQMLDCHFMILNVMQTHLNVF